MTAYIGSKNITDIYHGSTLIGQVYHGSVKVYDVNKWEKGEVIKYEKGSSTFEISLPKGVYQVCVTGAGGSGTIWVQASVGFASAGGSGACVEVQFYNPKRQNLKIYAGGSKSGYYQTGEDSYVELGGVRVITARGGRSGDVGSGGDGGTYFISDSLDIVKNIVKKNGNKGSVNLSGSVSAASVSPYDNWGKGQESSSFWGGLRLQYIRYTREE